MRFVANVPPHINGAEPTPTWWVVLGGVLTGLAVLVAVGAVLWRRHRYRKIQARTRDDGIEPLRRDYLALLAKLERQWQAGDLSGAEALRQCSRLARQFVAVVTDTGVDALTLAELGSRAMLRPELQPLVDLIAPGYQSRFAGLAMPDEQVPAALAGARRVIAEWD